MSKVFLYRTKAADDRDCCAYIEPSRFECEHYFSRICLQGACYSKHEFAPYKDIDTILTEVEYNKLIDFNKAIDKLGYEITKGDNRYRQGMKLCAEIQTIFDKLASFEAEEFLTDILESEAEVMMDEYCLDMEDIDEIRNNYKYGYQDRAIIACVFDNAEYLAECELENIVALHTDIEWLMSYVDYESFGEDLVRDSDDIYYELPSGKIVKFNC